VIHHIEYYPDPGLWVCDCGASDCMEFFECEEDTPPMNACCHCGAPAYGVSGLGLSYCDPCNTDSCLRMDENGDTYCGLNELKEDTPQ
jgi:hypothetical protein